MKKKRKIIDAAHIKHNTAGTSNEISFSVLDAAKKEHASSAQKKKAHIHFPRLGAIHLFTLGSVKKPAPTPTKERGLPLSTGEFASAESPQGSASSTPKPVQGFTVESNDAAGTASPYLPANPQKGASQSRSMAWQDSADEVARRKAARKRGKRMVTAAIALVVVAAAVMGSFTLYKGWLAARDVRGQLVAYSDAALQEVEGAGVFDQLVASSLETPLDEVNLDALKVSYSAEGRTVANVEASLSEIKASVEDLQAFLKDAGDLEASNRVLELVNAQTNALHAGQDVIDEIILAAQAHQNVSAGWEKIVAADALSRDAAVLASSTTIENVKASLTKSNDAMALLTEARGLFLSMPPAYLSRLSSYVDYIDLRVEAQRLAITSDQAYLDRNKELAQQANDGYNEVDARSVSLINEIGIDPLRNVSEVLDERVSEARASYASEHERVVAASTSIEGSLSKKQ